MAAVKAGAQDFLLKSELNPALLARAVRYAIERKRSEVELAHQALHDPLTALPNRALFLDRLSVALDRSRRTGAPVAVLFLDVDSFKQINDSIGPRGRRPAADRCSPTASARCCGRWTPSPASAATSSRSCSRSSRASARRC